MASRAAARPRREGVSELHCLPSKLHPPRPHVELVAREALVAALLKSAEPLVLLAAPAGSGKTVALTQWLRAESRPVIWLRLDGSENDPLLFLRHLAVALDQALGVDPEILALLQLRQPPLAEHVLPGLAMAVAGAPPFVLALDDAQLVQSEATWTGVAFVLENLPEGAQLVVASRVDPPLPLGRLRARGELLEVRFGELAFDRDEALALLRLHAAVEGDRAWAALRDGSDAAVAGERDETQTHDIVAALLKATEGWATGLYLASLAARGRSLGEWLPEVRGDQRAIADYLLGEVLERQPAALQQFLLETSILDELTAPLCAAVTGRAGAGAVLARLARENLFVSALDERDERFRYHHLFAELLRSRLERLASDDLEQLHRRAAVWYEGHEWREPAVRHYLAAGDVAATVSLAAFTLEQMANDGLDESARRLLDLYEEEQLLAYPDLALQAGWFYAIGGGTREERRRWTRLMMNLRFEDGPTATGAASLRSSWLMLMGDLGPQGLKEMRRVSEEALRLETEPGDWRDYATQNLAFCHYLGGSSQKAERLFRTLTREPPFAGTSMSDDFTVWNLAMLALIAEDAGRWVEAGELMSEAERRRPRMGLDQPPHAHWLGMLLARLRLKAHAGDPETMAFAAVIEGFISDLTLDPDCALIMSCVLLGEVALEQGAVAAARHACDKRPDQCWPRTPMRGSSGGGRRR